jgi:hypothetical protein
LFRDRTEAIIGLKPGPYNVFMNAYNEGLIDAPIVSISPLLLESLIGGLNTWNCSNWVHYDQQIPWTLTTTSIELLNIKQENAVVALDVESIYIHVPNDLFDPLLHSGTIKIINRFGTPHYMMLCNMTAAHFTVHLPNQTISLDVMKPAEDDSGFCYIVLLPYREYGFRHAITSGYSNQPTFVLGYAFIKHVCLCYNFAENRLGVGIPNE